MIRILKRVSLLVFIYLLAFFVFRFNASAQDSAEKKMVIAPTTHTKNFKKIFAVFDTSMGSFKARLFFNQAPLTVENFINLAEGKKSWIDPKTKDEKNNIPFYNNLIFHRVRKDLIQSGDPTGTGRFGSGHVIPDEFHPDLAHNKPGILSMANRGRGTADSQFFITLRAEKSWDNVHAIFGEIVEGMDVVEKISRVPINRANERPKTDVILKSVTIIRE
jgi:peptidyl-prolyl cis-trans isomerase A (cyclophilin A)